MTQVLIIADDLTGAADTGAQFARRGWRTLLALRHPRRGAALRHPLGGLVLEPGLPVDAEVLVLSTDSRALPGGEAAAAAVRAALAGIPLADIPLVYKKIDSTLRGHPAAELAALLDSLGETNALIAPAFPAQGRTTRGGAVYIHGVPLEQTSFGEEKGSASPLRRPLGGSSPGASPSPQGDPERGSASSPLKRGSGDLPRLFGQSTLAPLLALDTVRKGSMAIRMELEGKTGTWIADAETDGDLHRLAQAGLALGWRVLCGSAGLANALADCLGPRPAASAELELPFSSAPGALLAVTGSLHPATAAQVQAAVLQGAVLIHPAAEFFTDPGPSGVSGTAERLASALKQGGPVILATQAPTGSAIDAGDTARKLAQTAVRALAQALRRPPSVEHPKGCGGMTPTSGLFLTGGDTARAVCRELACTRLWLGGEVEPGMPWARLADGLFPGMKVVTKAGAFGGEGSLIAAFKYLEEN